MLVDNSALAGVNVLAALIILAREILVSGLREVPGGTARGSAGERARQMEDRRTDGGDRGAARRRSRVAVGRAGRHRAHLDRRARSRSSPATTICAPACATWRRMRRHRAARSEDPLFRLDEAHGRPARGRVTPPAEIDTVGDLIVWLRTRSPGHAEALAEGAAFGAAARPAHRDLRREAGRRARSRLLSTVHRRLTSWPCASRKPTSISAPSWPSLTDGNKRIGGLAVFVGLVREMQCARAIIATASTR